MRSKNLNIGLSSLGVKTKKTTWRLIYQLSDNIEAEKIEFGKFRGKEPTLADVLKINIEKHFYENFNGQYLGVAFLNENRTSAKTIHTIRTKLIKKGFDHNDGIFLYFGTKHYYIDKLVAKKKISKTKASDYVNVGIEMGWIKSLN